MMRLRVHLWRTVFIAVFAVGAFNFSGSVLAVESVGVGPETRSDDVPSKSLPGDLVLLKFDSPESQKYLSVPRNLQVTHQGHSIELAGKLQGISQSLSIVSGSQPWDLSKYLYLSVDIHNAGAQEVTIVGQVEDPKYVNWDHHADSVARVGAGETTSVLVLLKRKDPAPKSLLTLFPGMNAMPDGYMPHWTGLDPSSVCKIVLALESSSPAVILDLQSVRAIGVCDAGGLMAANYFPFIDAYGQFRHAEWPTKIHSPSDFAAQKAAEATAIAASPRPASWDQWGGFKDGPHLAASGSFRVEKYGGKWWFVDPDGRLFWSQGVTGVGYSITTPVGARKKFFAELAALNPLKGNAVNWYLSNLKIKYGDNAELAICELDQQRMSSWGMNTLASWSDPKVTSLDRTPYAKMLGVGGPRLAPKLSDPFDEAFARSARSAFEAEQSTTGKDPWCIGYFIGNELGWGAPKVIVNDILADSSKQAGKQEFVKFLQQRHPSINDLNTAWHTNYASWDAVLQSTDKVDAALATSDFAAFYEVLADRYYQICQAELKRALPNKLNLGSRFNTNEVTAIRACARYCDVVSFNKYETSLRGLRLPGKLDRPVIIGEFHFPAWDRSFAATADCGPLCEERRADSYWYYVTTALDNPQIVGTHWFQFLDQPLTGRGDGENSPIGFVDVTDTPYDQLTKVARELGDTMYARRLQGSGNAAAGAIPSH